MIRRRFSLASQQSDRIDPTEPSNCRSPEILSFRRSALAPVRSNKFLLRFLETAAARANSGSNAEPATDTRQTHRDSRKAFACIGRCEMCQCCRRFAFIVGTSRPFRMRPIDWLGRHAVVPASNEPPLKPVIGLRRITDRSVKLIAW